MYYGDRTTHTTPANPWDTNYQLVQHLGDTSGTTILDSSTFSSRNGTKHSSGSPAATSGKKMVHKVLTGQIVKFSKQIFLLLTLPAVKALPKVPG